MTPFDLTQCPPPEKFGPWRSMPSDTFITAGDVGRVRVRAVPGWGWKIDAEYCGTSFGCEAHTLADLPTAYRRALQAVGLAPDMEKAALQTEVEALRAQVAAERQRSREACQVLVAEVGANGPCSVGDAAARAVAVIDGLRAQVAALEAAGRKAP